MANELRYISADSYLIGIIDKCMAERGLRSDELCRRTGIKRSRYFERRRTPEAFTVRELREIARVLNFGERDMAYIFGIKNDERKK